VYWQCGRTGHLWRGCPRGTAKETVDRGDWRRDCAIDKKYVDSIWALLKNAIQEILKKNYPATNSLQELFKRTQVVKNGLTQLYTPIMLCLYVKGMT
jgi:hypothetical protein